MVSLDEPGEIEQLHVEIDADVRHALTMKKASPCLSEKPLQKAFKLPCKAALKRD